MISGSEMICVDFMGSSGTPMPTSLRWWPAVVAPPERGVRSIKGGQARIIRSDGKFESGDSGAWLMLRAPQIVSRLKTQPHFSIDTHPCLQP